MCRRRAIERVLKFTVLVLILAGIVVYFTKSGKRLLQEETVSDNSAEIGKFGISSLIHLLLQKLNKYMAVSYISSLYYFQDQ